MANPHPTKSKPVKIGRKHTGAPSVRQTQKKKRGHKITQQIKKAKNLKRRLLAAKFWRGETDKLP